MRKVSIQFTTAEGYALKIITAVKSGELPLLVTALGTLQNQTSAEMDIDMQICFNPSVGAVCKISGRGRKHDQNAPVELAWRVYNHGGIQAEIFGSVHQYQSHEHKQLLSYVLRGRTEDAKCDSAQYAGSQRISSPIRGEQIR